MKFKLSKPMDEASHYDMLTAEYKRLLGVESNALEDKNWKMLDEISNRQLIIVKKLSKMSNEDYVPNVSENAAVIALIKKMKSLNKKDGYVQMVDDRGIEVSVDMDSLDGEYIYGIDQHDNDVEIDLSSGDYTLLEADGSMDDVPVKTQGTSRKFKLKKDDDIDEVKANTDMKAKKLAKKKAKAKSKISCAPGKTPELIPGHTIRYKCTTLDKEASRKASRAGKKRAHSAAGKLSAKTAAKTRAFRAK